MAEVAAYRGGYHRDRFAERDQLHELAGVGDLRAGHAGGPRDAGTTHLLLGLLENPAGQAGGLVAALGRDPTSVIACAASALE